MRLDSANRSFYALVALVAAPYVALGVFGCGLVSYLLYRVTVDGWDTLTGDSDLRPALLFFTVVGAGAAMAGLSLYRQYRATRMLEQHVRGLRSDNAASVDEAAQQAKLAGVVDVVDEPDAFCFTYGLTRPRVVVSTGLLARVNAEELGAVLAHERYHVRHRDPLKLVIARALKKAFFFLPILRSLHARYLAGRELAADRRAVRDWGTTPLAGALVKAVSGPHWSELGAAAAIAGDQHLSLRVDQLERGIEPPLPSLPRPALWFSVAGVAAIIASLVLAIVAADGLRPMMMGTSADGVARWSPPAPLAALGVLMCTAMWGVAIYLVSRWIRMRHLTHRNTIESEGAR